MYRRILIPTDGSATARKAVDAGIALAKALGASVVGYYAVEAIEDLHLSEGAGARIMGVREIERRRKEAGEGHLAEIGRVAKAAGVAYDGVMSSPASPYQGIIDTARKRKCDLICIGSHGHGAIASAILGSVTVKVLAHSSIPVLVSR